MRHSVIPSRWNARESRRAVRRQAAQRALGGYLGCPGEPRACRRCGGEEPTRYCMWPAGFTRKGAPHPRRRWLSRRLLVPAWLLQCRRCLLRHRRPGAKVPSTARHHIDRVMRNCISVQLTVANGTFAHMAVQNKRVMRSDLPCVEVGDTVLFVRDEFIETHNGLLRLLEREKSPRTLRVLLLPTRPQLRAPSPWAARGAWYRRHATQALADARHLLREQWEAHSCPATGGIFYRERASGRCAVQQERYADIRSLPPSLVRHALRSPLIQQLRRDKHLVMSRDCSYAGGALLRIVGPGVLLEEAQEQFMRQVDASAFETAGRALLRRVCLDERRSGGDPGRAGEQRPGQAAPCPQAAAPTTAGKALQRLQQRMEEAAAANDYLLAMDLRDQIQQMQKEVRPPAAPAPQHGGGGSAVGGGDRGLKIIE